MNLNGIMNGIRVNSEVTPYSLVMVLSGYLKTSIPLFVLKVSITSTANWVNYLLWLTKRSYPAINVFLKFSSLVYGSITRKTMRGFRLSFLDTCLKDDSEFYGLENCKFLWKIDKYASRRACLVTVVYDEGVVMVALILLSHLEMLESII